MCDETHHPHSSIHAFGKNILATIKVLSFFIARSTVREPVCSLGGLYSIPNFFILQFSLHTVLGCKSTSPS